MTEDFSVNVNPQCIYHKQQNYMSTFSFCPGYNTVVRPVTRGGIWGQFQIRNILSHRFLAFIKEIELEMGSNN